MEAVIPALTTAIITTGVLLMLTIGILIAQDGETAKTRDAADWARIKGMFAEERTDLAGPEPVPAEVLAVHIGRRDANPAPDRDFVERIARELGPEGSPWRRAVSAELAIAQAQRIEAAPTWGEYRPRHRRESGAITQAFEAITARLVADGETTTEIAVRAA